MELTKYNISKSIGGNVILINTANGIVVEISEDDYNLLANNNIVDLQPAIYNELKEAGFIVGLLGKWNQANQVNSYFKKSKKINKMSKNLNIILMPTYGCNFACPYCSQNSIKANQHGTKSIENPKEYLNRVFEYLYENHSDKNIRITIYGGEPLLKSNKEYLTAFNEIVSSQKKVKINCVGMITNGYNIDYFLADLKYIDHFQITFDGPAVIHNRTRKLLSGGETFDKLIKNVELLRSLGKKIDLRFNFNKQNISYFSELIVLLEGKNLLESEDITLSFFPIFSSENLDWDKDDLNICFDYVKSDEKLLSHFSNYLLRDMERSMNWVLQDDYPYIFNPFKCHAYNSTYTFGPENFVYGCDNLIAEKKHRIGIIKEKIKILPFSQFIKRTERKRLDLKCFGCKFFLLCGRSCFIRKEMITEQEECAMGCFIDNLLDISMIRLIGEDTISE